MSVMKIQHSKRATCLCGAEFDGRNCEADAKRHARETGHMPTLEVSYDLIPDAPSRDEQREGTA